MTNAMRALCFVILSVGCADSGEMTAEEARDELSHVGEGLLALASPAGEALQEDDTLVQASGDDWAFSYNPGSTHDVFSGTLLATGRVLGQRISVDGMEWDAFDGQVQHSTVWVQPTELERAHSRHESMGLLEVTNQDGRWFRVHRLVVATFGNGICHRAEIEGSDGVLADDFDDCPPL